MTATCAVLKKLGGDEWKARAYGSLSVASSVSAGIKSNTQILKGRRLLMILNATLEKFFVNMREAMKVVEEMDKVAPQSSEKSASEEIAKAESMLKDLDELISKIYVQAKEMGLHKRTLTAVPFRKLREHIDELQDLREWYAMLVNPGPVNEIFARAEREADSEPVFDLSKVR